jgi:hypothetical protein
MSAKACEAVFRWAAARLVRRGFTLPPEIMKRYGPGMPLSEGPGSKPPTAQELAASGETAPTEPGPDDTDGEGGN